jgi:hypothetical protein
VFVVGTVMRGIHIFVPYHHCLKASYNIPNAMMRKIGSDCDSDACAVELKLWSLWEEKNREGIGRHGRGRRIGKGSRYECFYLYFFICMHLRISANTNCIPKTVLVGTTIAHNKIHECRTYH